MSHCVHRPGLSSCISDANEQTSTAVSDKPPYQATASGQSWHSGNLLLTPLRQQAYHPLSHFDRWNMPKSAKSAARKLVSGEVVIPDKLYFRIGEVGRLCGLPGYVLRFWETEFPQLKPSKSSTGQRMYRRSDVESVLRIKKLLYDQGFTIAGARQQMRTEARRKQGALPFNATAASRTELRQVRQGLREILGILSGRRPAGP